MPPNAVSVRLVLLLGLLLQLTQAAAPHASGLMLPGMRVHDTADHVCRSFKICHNSKGAAWTTVQLFSALEPLLTSLKLEPATEYIEVTPLQGCLTSGCCCSTPVEVRFSLPVHQDKQKAAAELAAVTDFLQFRLPRELKGTACTAGALGDCPPALAAERKLLSPEQDDTLPPLPAGLIPYDGKKPAPELEDPIPQPTSPPKPQPAKPKTPTDDPSLDPPLPAGLIPYDHKSTRQLLEESDAAIEEAAVAMVPEMPAVSVSALTGAAVLESGTPGVYGSSGRALLETVGGYGGRALLSVAEEAVGTYGGQGSGRSLLGEPAAAAAAAAGDRKTGDSKAGKDEQKTPEQKQQKKPKQEAAAKKEETPKQQQQQQKDASSAKDTTQKLTPTTSSSSSSSSAAPCSASNGTNSAAAPNGRPYGTCYCRYNPKDSTWALEQAACRAALFNRCKTAGALLECSQVESFYRGLSMPGSEAPHKDTLTAFLYADCPPSPPCSCKALLTGAETATARSRCCTDLQAHCQVPFSGLECEDVGRFCRPYGRQSSDPMGALFSFVLVKTHGFDCSSPRYAVSYANVVTSASSSRSDVDEAIRQLSKAAMVEGITRYDNSVYSEPDRVAALLTMLVGGCFAVFVAAVGVAVLFKMVSGRNHHTAPLLGDRL